MFFVFCFFLGNSLAIISSIKASDLPLSITVSNSMPHESQVSFILSVMPLSVKRGRCGLLGFSEEHQGRGEAARTPESTDGRALRFVTEIPPPLALGGCRLSRVSSELEKEISR